MENNLTACLGDLARPNHLLSLLNILLFLQKSVNWIDTILIITTLSAHS